MNDISDIDVNKIGGYLNISNIKYPLIKINLKEYKLLKLKFKEDKGMPRYIRLNKDNAPHVLPIPNDIYKISTLIKNELKEYWIGVRLGTGKMDDGKAWNYE